MDFKQSYMKKNHGTSYPSKMLFFDTETKWSSKNGIDKHSLWFLWSCYIERNKDFTEKTRQYKFYNSKYSFCKYIESKCYQKSSLYIFAHNAFFDLQVCGFFKYMALWGWELDFYYDKGLSYILTCRKDKKKIIVISTTNYFPVSLKKIGDMIGLEKLDVDIQNDNFETISTYCKRDLEILVKATLEYIDFIKKHDMGNFSMTKAGQAFSCFRHRFMKVNIGIHKNEKIINLERNAYMGGRTEAFFIGQVPGNDFVSLDINSMYPYLMKKYEYPTRLVDYQTNPDIEIIKQSLKRFQAVAKIRVKTNSPAYAYREKDKIFFPVGTFDCYVTTHGLNRAIQNNELKKIYEIAIYEKDYIFCDYVDYFYKLRMEYKKQGNKIYEQIVKILLNSLYGRFGMKYKKTISENAESAEDYYRIETYDEETKEYEIETVLLNKRITEGLEVNGKQSLVAIPAHITEAGRMMLYSIIENIGRNNVFYCDTDSIKIEYNNINKVNHEIHESNLGALKIEHRFDNLTIYGLKDYVAGDEVKIKGVPKNAEKIEDNIYKYKQFCGQSTHLREREVEHFIVKDIVKQLYRIYDKGKVTSSGFVKPFRL